ncbi:MAG: T9SS type A sorting domain-containing protein [Stygiobacter sp.]
MKIIILLLLCVFLITIQAQQKFPIAPEIWSEPVILDTVFARQWQEAASFTPNIDTAYYEGGAGIYMSFKKNDKWVSRVKLNSNINDQDIAYRTPTISKNGKRLYFSAWKGYGGWDIWYCDRDTNTNDWGISHNMGNVINNSWNQLFLYEISKDTVFCLSQSSTALYTWNNQKNNWVKADSFWYHDLGIGDIKGIAIPSNFKKIYYSRSIVYNSPKYWHNGDILVTYWDTTKNYWGDPYSLNINTIPKPYPDSSRYYGGGEFYPWISPNGKILIFTKYDYDDTTNSSPKIFISYLLVDENGIPVNIKDEHLDDTLATGYNLSNYPNPFNNTTKINYKLAVDGKVTIHLFDLLGRQIDTLIEGVKSKGSYSFSLDLSKYKLSSGIYFCTLITKHVVVTNKLLYLK